MNDVVADHVATTANLVDSTEVAVSEATTEGLSLEDKIDVTVIANILEGGSHDFDFIVLTEVWDYQNYDPGIHGSDSNAAPSGCPSSYTPPTLWTSPEQDFSPTPLYLQKYRDAFICGNTNTKIFYYQTWSLGYNEVENGATRLSDKSFTRPSFQQELVMYPDLALADRIEYEGFKWQKFVASSNRPDIIFIPAAYALAAFMRDIENGVAPGFEALADTAGLYNGKLAWTDCLFYEDQYHLASIGHYLMAQVIYASVFNKDPTGTPIGSSSYGKSEYFPEGEYPLYGLSDTDFQSMLAEAGAAGVYDLKGYQSLDYVPDSLRDYLQTLAWNTVSIERKQIK